MNLTSRKPRPIKRDADSFRDDRLFIVACDDRYAPKQYFEFFKISRVKIAVIPTEDGKSSANHVLSRLLSYEHDADDELWLLLDTDHYTDGSHKGTFLKTLKDAKRRQVFVALSKPCFELWLLLHYLGGEDVFHVKDARDAERLLREQTTSYDKTKLNAAHFPAAKVAEACHRVRTIAENNPGGLIPSKNMSDVFRLWEAIVRSCLPSQIDPCLLSILSKDKTIGSNAAQDVANATSPRRRAT